MFQDIALIMYLGENINSAGSKYVDRCTLVEYY